MNLTLSGRGEIKMVPHHIKYASGNWVKVYTLDTEVFASTNLIMNFSMQYKL